jgi:hypothetical protein
MPANAETMPKRCRQPRYADVGPASRHDSITHSLLGIQTDQKENKKEKKRKEKKMTKSTRILKLLMLGIKKCNIIMKQNNDDDQSQS